MKYALITLALFVLSGCAHKDLKAPCTGAALDTAVMLASTDGCGKRHPLNVALGEPR